jgi:hypothetical protein
MKVDMRSALDLAAACLLLFASTLWAQTPGHSQHAPAKAAAPAETQSHKPGMTQSPAGALYRSAFEDYRPFTADEPAVDWRAANDRVREAGGHVGLMKGASKGAGDAAHAGHGAKQGSKDARK